jgi:hypothetical protein
MTPFPAYERTSANSQTVSATRGSQFQSDRLSSGNTIWQYSLIELLLVYYQTNIKKVGSNYRSVADN